ncbi:hypothetical protein [Streptomyces prunicolor]
MAGARYERIFALVGTAEPGSSDADCLALFRVARPLDVRLASTAAE